MKKTLLSLLLFIATFASYQPLMAQANKVKKEAKMMTMSSDERATKMTDWMKTNLNLTDDQVSKVSAINMKYAKQNQQIYNGTNSKEKKMEMMKTNEAAKEKEIKSVLNDEQFKTYKQKRNEMHKQFKEDWMDQKEKMK